MGGKWCLERCPVGVTALHRSTLEPRIRKFKNANYFWKANQSAFVLEMGHVGICGLGKSCE